MLASIKGYLYLAAFLAVLAAIGAIYAKGRIDARHAVELRTLQTQIKTLVDEREREEAARRLDAVQAKTDREEADLQDLHAKELRDALKNPDDVCFDAGDADGLRNLINGQH